MKHVPIKPLFLERVNNSIILTNISGARDSRRLDFAADMLLGGRVGDMLIILAPLGFYVR